MLQRLLVFALTVTLITVPAGPVVAPAGSIAYADSGYCEIKDMAHARLYADGTLVGSAGGQFVYSDAETSAQCAAVAQNYALFDAGNACGAYGAGVAYVQVKWSIIWEQQQGSEVVEQYDCGDV